MSKAFDKIISIWSDFPKELVNETIHHDLNNVKNYFQEKIQFFDDYLTKIVIIGDVSTGKSTLINTFLGHEYFDTRPGHGTPSFFYCSISDKDYEYFTVNDDDVELKDINVLRSAGKSNDNKEDNINYETVIKAYLKNDKYGLLKNGAVIVDCPGLGYRDLTDQEVETHCVNADLFIFIFHIGKPITDKQRNYIKNKMEKFKNSPCFFLYNKCDVNEFNDKMKTTLKNDFYELFRKEYLSNNGINYDPLYFISATNPNNSPDFSRLKEEIKTNKDNCLFRTANVRSILKKKINEFFIQLNQFISSKKEKKMSLIKEIEKKQSNNAKIFKSYSSFTESYRRIIEEFSRNFNNERVIDIITKEIRGNNEKCKKENAFVMISNIGDSIDKKVIEFIEEKLQTLCIDNIEERLNELKKEKIINLYNKINFKIPRNGFNIPNIKNLSFWWFEFGDKTEKTKNAYIEYLKTESVKEEINKSISQLFEVQISRIKAIYEDIIESSKGKYLEEETNLNYELKNVENLLEILIDYEKNVCEHIKNYKTSISQFIY